MTCLVGDGGGCRCGIDGFGGVWGKIVEEGWIDGFEIALNSGELKPVVCVSLLGVT
jgi:hypothetical protein